MRGEGGGGGGGGGWGGGGRFMQQVPLLQAEQAAERLLRAQGGGELGCDSLLCHMACT